MTMGIHIAYARNAGIGCALMVLGEAHAAGLDRNGQGIQPLFEKGRYISVDAFYSQPSINGVDIGGRRTGNVAPSHSQFGFSYKQDVNAQTAFAVMLTRPFGLDISYPRNQSPLFAGTQVNLTTHELVGVGRLKLNDHWAVHGGLRLQQSSGSVTLAGMGFGKYSGYHVNFTKSTEPGYLAGLTYERPDIALRIALTYYSAIKHQLKTRENILPGTSLTNSTSPQAINVDLQTGITPSTLVFGKIRWGNWAEFELRPQAFAAVTKGRTLTDLDNALTYSLGLSQKFNLHWSGFVAMAYDKKSRKKLLSPLRPSNGRMGYTAGVSYQNARIKVTPWISYQRLGAADISTTQMPLTRFPRGSAKAAGLQLGYYF